LTETVVLSVVTAHLVILLTIFNEVLTMKLAMWATMGDWVWEMQMYYCYDYCCFTDSVL